MTDLDETLGRLDEIERRAMEATAGPWQPFIEGRDHQSGDDFIRTGGSDDESPDMYVTLATHETSIPVSPNDLDFIAHARQDVPDLIVALRSMTGDRTHPSADIPPSYPTVVLPLWRSDAIVLFDWLMSVDLEQASTMNPAQRQALVDLLARLESDTDVPYGSSGTGLTQDEIDAATAEVAKDMGW